MALLEALKLVVNPATQPKSTEQLRRSKLIAKLEEQRNLAEAHLGGAPYKRMRWITAPNMEGEPVRIQRPVRLKQWWTKTPSGSVLLTVRYGAKPLPISNGMTAIDVGDMEALPQTISTLIQAVDAGELDAELAAASKDRRIDKTKVERKPAAKK